MGIIDTILGRSRKITSGAKRSGSDLRFKVQNRMTGQRSLSSYGEKAGPSITIMGVTLGLPALIVLGLAGYWFFIR